VPIITAQLDLLDTPMKNALPVLLAALLSLVSVFPAHAGSGVYLGAGVGQTTIKDDTGAGTFDAHDPSYKGFLGYRSNIIPIIDLAAEIAYTEFGKPSQTVGRQYPAVRCQEPAPRVC
jgi:hypothetical protein